MYQSKHDINDPYFKSIYKNVKTHLQSFISIWDEEDVYPIMFEFANYLIENCFDTKVLEKGANFINEALDEGASGTEDLVVLQVFQVMFAHPECSNRFKKYLNNRASIIFHDAYIKWNKA